MVRKIAPKRLEKFVRVLCLLPMLLSMGNAFSQNCTGLGSSQFSDIIHVSVTGSNSGSGTQTDPVDLFTGVGMLGGNADKIYLQGGVYIMNQPLVMPSNAQLIGGFNSNWVKDNTSVTTLFRSQSNFQVGPPRLIGVLCVGKSNFKLQDLTIRTDNAPGPGQGVTTYGVYLNNCSDYQIVRCKIISGNGGQGSSGSPGSGGIAGAPGEEGDPGADNSGGDRNGGVGGCCSFPGSNAGGAGGAGGERGTYEFPAGGQAFPGYPGELGQGQGFGSGGDGGQGNFTTILSTQCDRTPANDGDPGGTGADGIAGTPGFIGVSSFSGGFFVPGTGTVGENGTNGSGGGGGGGGGSYGGQLYVYVPWPIDDTIPNNRNGTGAGGGGGGEGGQFATGGTGGQGAGSSFAVFIWDNGFNTVMKDCELESGIGGIGGNGGLGGIGGAGGIGGEGGAFYTACYIGAGREGGNGGKGGDGGKGGKGSDGLASDLYQHPGGQPILLQNIYGLSQPSVEVTYGGCTNAPVTFSADVSGTIQWFFGAGASPTSAYGQEVVTSFSTPGFKTFTLVVNGVAFTYTDYVDVHAVVPALDPQIQTGPTQLCAGDIVDFNSSISANNYIWQLNNIEGDTVIYDGPNYYNLLGVVFDSAGVYQLTLTTETECCGQSFTDTIIIEVDSIVLPSVAIQTQFADTTNTVCEQTEMTFTATASNLGSSPTYQWQINGTPSGGNAPVFTTSQLLNSDVVTCEVTSSLGCATGETAMSNGIGITVIPPPEITCQADSFLSGEPTYFQVEVTTGGLAPFEYYWTFGDGTLGFGSVVQHIYQNPGNYTATVDVRDSLGCSVSCQSFMTISPSLSADFTLDTLVGCAPFQVNFTNQSENAVTNYWSFGDGSGSNELNPTHIYQAAGTYDVGLWVYSGTGTDSAFVSSQVFVNPNPVANFQDFQINAEGGGDTVQFADNSIFADSWLWNFDDPSSGVNNTSTEQSPMHIFSANGNYHVTLWVSNNYGCRDSISLSSSVNVGIEEILSEYNFVVYPNPATDWLEVIFTSEAEGESQWSVHDALGKNVLSKEINLTSGRNNIGLDVTQLSDGPYVLLMQMEGKKYSHHFVVSKK